MELALNRATPIMESFDESKYYLGRLCKRGHDWNGTGQSLRNLIKKDCLECLDIRRKIYAESEHGRSKRKAYLSAYSKTEQFRSTQRRYKDSEKGQETRRRYNSEYNQRPNVIQRKREHDRKPDVTERRRIYQQQRKHSDERKASLRRYYLSEHGRANVNANTRRRRARKRSAHTSSYSPSQLRQHFDLFENRCAYCQSNRRISIDHVLPVSLGGSDCLGNLVPACSTCNQSKSNRDVFEWFRLQSFYSEKQWRKILRLLGKTEDNYNQIPLL